MGKPTDYTDPRLLPLVEYVSKGLWNTNSNEIWRNKIMNSAGTGFVSDRSIRFYVSDIRKLIINGKLGPKSITTPPQYEGSLKIEETYENKVLSAQTPEQITSLDEAIAFFKVDLSVWIVDRYVCNVWNMGFKNEDGEADAKELYQVKMWLKRIPPKQVAIYDDIKAMLEDARGYMPVYGAAKIHRPRNIGEHALEVDIPDLHCGKLAYGEETGGENYDCNIAEALFNDAIERMIVATSNYDICEIVFPVGNDLLNCDNSSNTTTAGTPQSVDGRQKKTFKRVRTMIIGGIERLREIAPVKVIGIVGNHDTDSSWYLLDSVEGWMHKATDVTFDNHQYPRKTYTFGANGILFTHGEEKRQDLPLTFASDFPDVWAASTYREVHCGHLHRTITEDFRGALVRFLPSLSAQDFWHSNKNYKSRRASTCFVWSRRGETAAQFTFNVPADKTIG